MYWRLRAEIAIVWTENSMTEWLGKLSMEDYSMRRNYKNKEGKYINSVNKEKKWRKDSKNLTYLLLTWKMVFKLVLRIICRGLCNLYISPYAIFVIHNVYQCKYHCISRWWEIYGFYIHQNIYKLEEWLNLWRIRTNTTNSVYVTFTLRNKTCPPIQLNLIPQAH